MSMIPRGQELYKKSYYETINWIKEYTEHIEISLFSWDIFLTLINVLKVVSNWERLTIWW